MDITDHEAQFETNPTILPDDKNVLVIVGGNNSVKSTFLRSVTKPLGVDAYRVDVNRTILLKLRQPTTGLQYGACFPNCRDGQSPCILRPCRLAKWSKAGCRPNSYSF